MTIQAVVLAFRQTVADWEGAKVIPHQAMQVTGGLRRNWNWSKQPAVAYPLAENEVTKPVASDPPPSYGARP